MLKYSLKVSVRQCIFLYLHPSSDYTVMASARYCSHAVLKETHRVSVSQCVLLYLHPLPQSGQEHAAFIVLVYLNMLRTNEHTHNLYQDLCCIKWSLTFGSLRSFCKGFENCLGHSNLITCLTSFFWKKNPVRP